MKPRILLIEDKAENCYMETYLLEHNGCEVISADTGPAGLALARSRSFDLVLLDIQLPGMDGYAVARALRAEANGRTVPIVAVTSFAMVGDREKALAAGCDGYIEKPIDPDRFVSDIFRFLQPGEQ